MRFLLGGKAQGRLICGVVGLVLSLGYGFQAATSLPLGHLARPGAAVFPLVVGALLLVASLAVIFEQRGAALRREEAPFAFPRGVDRRRLLGTPLAIAAYILLAQLVGHPLASFVLALAIVHLVRPGPWRRTVFSAFGVSATVYVLFQVILDVPLPKGIL